MSEKLELEAYYFGNQDKAMRLLCFHNFMKDARFLFKGKRPDLEDYTAAALGGASERARGSIVFLSEGE